MVRNKFFPHDSQPAGRAYIEQEGGIQHTCVQRARTALLGVDRHLETPQSSSAVVQGGVRPKWLHGSNVTYAVPPRARSPAWRIAQTCGSHVDAMALKHG